jgi:hypothetical protein
LPDVVQTRALKLSPKELTKGWRTGRIAQWTGQQMKSCGLRLARDEQPVGFARHPEFKEKSAVSGLIDFLKSRLD